MKTKDRNELIQKMLEFANIDIEGKQVEYNDQIIVFHIIIDKHIYILYLNGEDGVSGLVFQIENAADGLKTILSREIFDLRRYQ